MPTASSKNSARRRAPTRRPHHRYKPIKMGNTRKIVLASLAGIGAVGLLVLWAVIARQVAPMSNTGRDHFDAIVVLGYPADDDGNPTPEQLARVTEGVREYERGVAPRLLFTGGAVGNHFVEADVMARVAAAQGIPPSAIFVETKAKDTIENACFSARLMSNHGWRSAEVVSTGYHLPRAGMIFSHTPLEWRMHPASALQGSAGSQGTPVLETLKTMRYLVYANWAERCDPQGL
ncbi:MAG: YdcF family protein [Acidobacteria bacterium]|nr:YdcF family protein [Acidobacteriota bacterium]